MSEFSTAEAAFLAEDGHLGRLATVDPDGLPHVVPLGWSHNTELNTIDIGGRDPAEFAATRKFRNVEHNPKVAFVVDVVQFEPWKPRAVMVRGTAEAISRPSDDEHDATSMIRITPDTIISWGLDD